MKFGLLVFVLTSICALGHAQEIEGLSICFTLPDGAYLEPVDNSKYSHRDEREQEEYNIKWSGNNRGNYTFSISCYPKSGDGKNPPPTIHMPPGGKYLQDNDVVFPALSGRESIYEWFTDTGERMVTDCFILRDQNNVWVADFIGEPATPVVDRAE